MYIAAAFLPLQAQAQNTLPDAGAILESTRPPTMLAPPPTGTKLVPETQVDRPALRGAQRVRVARFVLQGVSAFPEQTLLDLLQPFAGREITFDELSQAAGAITEYYRRHGYFLAAAYLPPQEIRQGEVAIQVLEGRLSAIRLVPQDSVRLQSGIARGYLEGALTAGAAIREQDLERALLLIQDLPGMAVRAEMHPGDKIGETAIDVGLTEGPLVSGRIGLDNASNQYTGRTRLMAGLNLNDPLGWGGQLGVLGMTSGANFMYGRLGYVMPVGAYGTKLGLSYSSLNYQLGKQFASLNAKGTAKLGQLALTHPLLRSRYANLTVRGGYDDKRYFNEASGATISHKHVVAVPLGLTLATQDNLLGGGVTTTALDMTLGRVDLSRDAAFQTSDAAGPRSEGHFVRTNFQLGRLQSLTDRWSLLFNTSGQLASKNLESGEKISLGGPGRVRAYPAGEASGDEGLLLTIEGRYKLPLLQAEVSLFYDYGNVRLHRNPYPGALVAGGPPNRYSLHGAGAGIHWQPAAGLQVQVEIATRLGNNPGANAQGQDADGSTADTRGWVQLTAYF